MMQLMYQEQLAKVLTFYFAGYGLRKLGYKHLFHVKQTELFKLFEMDLVSD